MVWLSAIITDAELKPDELLSDTVARHWLTTVNLYNPIYNTITDIKISKILIDYIKGRLISHKASMKNA